MYSAQIQKWGNSQGLRLPKTLLELAKMNLNDMVEIFVDDEKITITKSLQKQRSLEDIFAGYQGNFKCSEWDTGDDKGAEEV